MVSIAHVCSYPAVICWNRGSPITGVGMPVGLLSVPSPSWPAKFHPAGERVGLVAQALQEHQTQASPPNLPHAIARALMTQAPSRQSWSGVQAVEQLPQVWGAAKSASQPLLGSSSQLSQPTARAVAAPAWETAGSDEHYGRHQTRLCTADQQHPSAHGMQQASVRRLHTRHTCCRLCCAMCQPYTAPCAQLATSQVPVAQVAVAWDRAHVLLHLPQLVVVLRRVSQPVSEMPSQSPQPASTQQQRQGLREGTRSNKKQMSTHIAKSHIQPAGQLDNKSTPPSCPFPSHPTSQAQPAPAAQLATSQVPVAQVPVAWDRAHVLLHLPQLEVVLRRVSQPLAGLLSQSPQPAASMKKTCQLMHNTTTC